MMLNEKQFILGFNSGYLLAKYESKMIKAILNGIHPANNSFIWGLSLGQKEYELELERRELDRLERIRNKDRGEMDRHLG